MSRRHNVASGYEVAAANSACAASCELYDGQICCGGIAVPYRITNGFDGFEFVAIVDLGCAAGERSTQAGGSNQTDVRAAGNGNEYCVSLLFLLFALIVLLLVRNGAVH